MLRAAATVRPSVGRVPLAVMPVAPAPQHLRHAQYAVMVSALAVQARRIERVTIFDFILFSGFGLSVGGCGGGIGGVVGFIGGIGGDDGGVIGGEGFAFGGAGGCGGAGGAGGGGDLKFCCLVVGILLVLR